MVGTAATSEAAILGRLVQPERADLSPEAARSILKLEFDERDRSRMHELAHKGQDGALSEEEQGELESYRRVGRLVDLLRSKARRSLREDDAGA